MAESPTPQPQPPKQEPEKDEENTTSIFSYDEVINFIMNIK